MPRTARIVVPGVAHHVTQRGNRRQQTFFCEADYCRYVELVGEGCRNAGVDVLAWCLMPNHVHLVLVPSGTEGLGCALALAHRSYTWVINRRNGWQGHLWQNRFFSCPMDEEHTMKVVRYVEMNPVRARLVERPQDWRWSSAGARISGGPDPLVGGGQPRAACDGWAAFLAEGLAEEDIEIIRAHQTAERPLGSAAFLARIEAEIGRPLRRRPRGRPRREGGDFASSDLPSLPLMD